MAYHGKDIKKALLLNLKRLELLLYINKSGHTTCIPGTGTPVCTPGAHDVMLDVTRVEINIFPILNFFVHVYFIVFILHLDTF